MLNNCYLQQIIITIQLRLQTSIKFDKFEYQKSCHLLIWHIIQFRTLAKRDKDQMSVPFIQIGQCGNQIGRKFYEKMFDEGVRASDGHESLLQSFFSLEDPQNIKAKAFSIDMEPKVVQKNLKMKDKWSYDKKLSLVSEEGSGNNWAYGCNQHGPKNREGLQNLFQKLAQRQDYIQSFVQIQSMAGGTGSGLGTYISQLLSDNFSKTPKFIISIMPHLSGEVILQSYNAALSLSTIYLQVDGIFIIENDEISNLCTKILNQQKAGLDDINQIIGRNIASVFFPAISKGTGKIYSVEQNQFHYSRDLLENLFFDPRFKLSSIKTAPHGPKNSESFNSDNWQSLQNDLTYRKRHKSIAEILIARGPDHPNSLSKPCFTILDKHSFYNYNKSMTLLDNGQQFLPSLQKIIERGYSMLKQNSYIYQYEKYGINKDSFLDCFSQIENVLMNYSKL